MALPADDYPPYYPPVVIERQAPPVYIQQSPPAGKQAASQVLVLLPIAGGILSRGSGMSRWLGEGPAAVLSLIQREKP